MRRRRFLLVKFQLYFRLLKEHRDIEVKIKTDRKQVLQEMLSYGEIDGLFLSGTYNGAQFERVYHYAEKVVLISPTSEDIEEKPHQCCSSIVM